MIPVMLYRIIIAADSNQYESFQSGHKQHGRDEQRTCVGAVPSAASTGVNRRGRWIRHWDDGSSLVGSSSQGLIEGSDSSGVLEREDVAICLGLIIRGQVTVRSRCTVEDDGCSRLGSGNHTLDCLVDTQLSRIVYRRVVTGNTRNLGAMIAQRVSGSHLSKRASDVKTLEGRAISIWVGSLG
jgi:hypothetical protein